MAQVRQVVSEALQSTVRRLLPSQQGFTEDLQASNVIMPIIDLTPTAEGSQLPTDLARAIAFGSQTAFDVINTTTVIVNNAGFYRIFGAATANFPSAAVDEAISFDLSDGLSSKKVWEMKISQNGVGATGTLQFDFVVFLTSGDSLSTTASSRAHCVGSTRQIADINGNIVNPSGFTVS